MLFKTTAFDISILLLFITALLANFQNRKFYSSLIQFISKYNIDSKLQPILTWSRDSDSEEYRAQLGGGGGGRCGRRCVSS